MPIKKSQVNKRRIEAITKRVTNKTAADLLGISPSTLYRYKTGKVKNPRLKINKNVDELWNSLKTSKPTKSLKLKRKRVKAKLLLFKQGEKWFKDSRIKNHIYRTYNKIDNKEILETFIQRIFKKINSPYFSITLVGVAIELHGEEIIDEVKAFSTPFRNIKIDNVDTIWNDLLILRSQPSKQLKRLLYHEIICKQFFNQNMEPLT